MSVTHNKLVVTPLAAGVALVLAAAAPALPSIGESAARGAFTCDFGVSSAAPLDGVAPLLERDRIYMTRRPGMLNKHLPLRPDPATGLARSGGRYLFDTHAHAQAYLDWVRDDFVLDGTHFFERPYFIDPDCHAWATIGAHDFGDIHDSRVVMRTERWAVPATNQRAILEQAWPDVRAAAEARGLTSAWLLYSRAERLVTLVYYDDHAVAPHPDALDGGALTALETAPPLGAALERPGWERRMDLTHWVLTIWFPNPQPTGDTGEPSLWPNSPPLPEPSTSDGLCEPSRGENHDTAPSDCTPHCGDGHWDPDEDNHRCPSDVPFTASSSRTTMFGQPEIEGEASAPY